MEKEAIRHAIHLISTCMGALLIMISSLCLVPIMPSLQTMLVVTIKSSEGAVCSRQFLGGHIPCQLAMLQDNPIESN